MREDSVMNDTSALRDALEERSRLMADYSARELELFDEASRRRAERVRWWEGLITETRRGAWSQQMGSYKSLARSMAGLLGASVKDQAKVMIPFEVAEATKEFARFLGTRDPSALASSLKHALAARQYAAAAKSASPSGGSGGPSAAGGDRPPAPRPGGQRREGGTRVIVNVGRQVGLVDTYEFARTLIDAINENVADDVILEVAE